MKKMLFVNIYFNTFQKFATEGLRTLLLGIRDLTEQEFNDWKTAHHNAAIALENREAKLDQVYDTIERDLDILGATAIEDKLQVHDVIVCVN